MEAVGRRLQRGGGAATPTARQGGGHRLMKCVGEGWVDGKLGETDDTHKSGRDANEAKLPS